MSMADYSTWRFFAQPVIWYYASGPSSWPIPASTKLWFPGRYLGQGPLQGPDGLTYTLGEDQWGAGPNGMPGLWDLLFDSANMLRLPSGTIIFGSYSSQNPVADTAVVVRTTEEAMFNGIEKGVVGYWNANQAIEMDGRGAYTYQLLEFGQLNTWSGLSSWQPHLCFTGQNLLVLIEAGDEDLMGLQTGVRLFVSTDDGKTLTEHTTWLDGMPLIERELQGFAPDTVIRGAVPNTADQIQHKGVKDVLEIPTTITSVTSVRRISPNTLYTQGTDYTRVGTTISWAPGGAEPSAGQAYNVVYRYMSRPDWPVQIQSDGVGTVYATIEGGGALPDVAHIVRSLDHGATWEFRSVLSPSIVTSTVPTTSYGLYGDENAGLLVLSRDVVLLSVFRASGPDMAMLRSVDGGLTWTEVYLHDAYYQTAFLNLGGGQILATVNTIQNTGDLPLIIRSVDAGITWTGVFTYNPSTENAVYPSGWDPCGRFVRVNQDEIIIGSQQGRIYYSGDLGLTWTPTSSESQQVITYQATVGEPCCSAGDNRHVLYVGGDGFIFTNVPTPERIAREANRDTMIVKGRTVYLKDNEYQYTHQMSLEDFGSTDPALGANIGGARTIYIQVRLRTVLGLLGPPAGVLLTNPMPDMSGIPLTMTAGVQSVIVDWATYKSPDPDPDYFEVQVGYSPDPVMLTRTFRRAKDQNNVIVPNIPPGTTVYARVLPYDVFGGGVPTGIYSVTVT